MKINKKITNLLMVFSFIFLLGSCVADGTLIEIHQYERDLWGEWVRMDNGDTWYFGSNFLLIKNSGSSLSASFERQSTNVVKVTEISGWNNIERTYFLFASRLPNSTFTGTVVSDIVSDIEEFESFSQGRSAMGGLGNFTIPGINLNDSSNVVTATTDNNGNVTFEGVIAGDEYELIIDDYSITVQANTDGEDVGTITVTDGINFKASVRLQNANNSVTGTRDLMTLYDNQNYGIDIIVTNVGTTQASMSSYVLDIPSSITFTGDDRQMLGTIPPGGSRTLELRNLRSDPITEEFEFKKIGIRITDHTRLDMAWEDSVSLRFNRDRVSFNIKAVGPGGASGTINGMIIVPGGRAYHFTASGWGSTQNTQRVIVPRYTGGNGYLVVFSGATVGSETSYAFNVGTDPADIPTNFIPDNFYLQHITEDTAYRVSGGQEIRSFLGENSVSFFRVILD